MKIVWKIIKGIMLVSLVLILLLVLFQKVTNSKLAIGNVYIFQVATKSMTPVYKVGDILVVKKTSPDKINIGDDVTYLGTSNSVKDLRITHRVVDKKLVNNKYYFTTKGIANEVEDPVITEDNLYGKVIYKTMLYSFIGRLMTNTVVYYLVFIIIGASLSYDIIVSFVRKDDEEDEEEVL